MITYPIISFGKTALETKADIAYITGTHAYLYDDLTVLQTDELASPYATFALDFWLLDGSYKFIEHPSPSNGTHAGYISERLSNVTGAFSSPQTLTVGFNSVHTTNNLYVHFSEATGDYISKMRIQFFDASNNNIYLADVFPTGTIYHLALDIGDEVVDFKKLTLTLYMTNKPYRYGYVQGLDFETVTQFTGEDIKSCTIVEELNPTSAELPINTCEFSVFSSSASASVVNPTGSYSILQYHAPLDVYEQYGSLRMYMGRFYVDEWDSPSTNELHFRCVDALGVLDGETFHGWIAYESIQSGIKEILGGLVDFEIPALFSASGSMVGNIPIMSRREALQTALIGLQASASCARSNKIIISRSDLAANLSIDYTIDRTEERITSLELRPIVTQVDYLRQEEEQSTTQPLGFYSATFVSGTYTLAFTEPHYNITLYGGTKYFPTGSYNGAFAAEFSTTGGSIIISGSPMNLLNHPYRVQTPLLTGKKNVLQANVTVNTPDLMAFYDGILTQWFYDYYQQRHLHKCRLYGHTVKTGDVVLIDTLGNAQLRGIVEKLTLDLAGGFRIDAEIVGNIV